jgi:uncharacterized protein
MKNMEEAESDELEKEIDRLALLQEVDQRLRSRRLDAGSLDEEIREREQQLSTRREAVSTLQSTSRELEARRRDLEQRLEDEEIKMKDRRMRLNRVRSEKELQAIRREIELGKEANQQMETELLTCMEQQETTGQGLQEALVALEELESPVTEEIAERRGRLSNLERDSEEDHLLRQRLAEKLDDGLRSKYEQIFERRGGLAVVEVRNSTCLGCHMNLPPQLFNEIQKTRDVRLCPNCHRMLFWRPDGNGAGGR